MDLFAEITAVILEVRKALTADTCPRFERWMREYESEKDRSPTTAMDVLSVGELGYLPDEFARGRDTAIALLNAAIDVFGKTESVRGHLRKAKAIIAENQGCAN